MKANYQLIKVLRETAEYVKNNPDKYNWENSSRCNCGLVARVANKLLEVKDTHVCSWEFMIDLYVEKETASKYYSKDDLNLYFCSESQLSYKDIINSLLKLGFELEDFQRLEDLTSDKGSGSLNRSKSFYLIKWLKQEANKLEKELMKSSSNTVAITVPVPVSV